MSEQRKVAWIGLCAATVVGVGWWLGNLNNSVNGNPTDLTFFAVGQGDAALFRHQGVTVLIDAGPRTDRFDSGERILAPKLREMGVDRLDVVILSHPDLDHIGGLGGLARRKKIGKVVIAEHFTDHPQLAEMLQEAGVRRCDVVTVAEASVMEIGDFRLELFAPKWNPETADNEGSLFVKLSGPGGSAAFTGDGNQETELSMIRRTDWDVDVLKAGHHGSRESTGVRWLSETTPAWVVLCAGRDNPYGHPTQDVLDRAAKAGAKTLRTDRDGTITFLPSPSGFVPR